MSEPSVVLPPAVNGIARLGELVLGSAGSPVVLIAPDERGLSNPVEVEGESNPT